MAVENADERYQPADEAKIGWQAALVGDGLEAKALVERFQFAATGKIERVGSAFDQRLDDAAGQPLAAVFGPHGNGGQFYGAATVRFELPAAEDVVGVVDYQQKMAPINSQRIDLNLVDQMANSGLVACAGGTERNHKTIVIEDLAESQ